MNHFQFLTCVEATGSIAVMSRGMRAWDLLLGWRVGHPVGVARVGIVGTAIVIRVATAVELVAVVCVLVVVVIASTAATSVGAGITSACAISEAVHCLLRAEECFD